MDKLSKPTCRRTTRTKITIEYWVCQLEVLLWGSRLHKSVSHRFFARISARIFCTDFFARIFCTDFFARIFCTDFLHVCLPVFCMDFCADCRKNCLHRCLRGFLHDFWGVPNHLLESAKSSPRKSPGKFTMLWGPSGEGLERQEGEVRLWPA